MISSVIMFIVILLLYAVIIKMQLDMDKEDEEIYVNVLKKEVKIFFPIGTLLWIYQVVSVGELKISPQTPTYILMFLYLMDILVILYGKYTKIRNIEMGKASCSLCFCIVLTPICSILFLILMFLNKCSF